ncbi:MAG: hypothetical protein BV459_01785, partial [Thermoplasmata archaeon M11B2D]
SIELAGGLVLLGKTKTGTIDSLPIDDSIVITDKPVIGLGKVTITVTVEVSGEEPMTKSASGFLLFFFVLGVK